MSENPTPYTLNEFDIVLSITEAAINAQFMHLFLTELPPPLGPDGQPVDPPPPVPGEPEPEKEYLISHNLELKLSPTQKNGLFGHIECPRVDFNNLSPTADKKRTVKVIFKFLANAPGTQADPDRGIPAYDPKYDSKALVWDYLALDDEGRPTLRPFDLNGYSITFEAGLGRADIQEVMEKRYMYPGTYNALKKGIDSKALLPCSLFCLFQGDQIANTFKLINPSGVPVEEEENKGLVGGFMQLFSNKYAKPTKKPEISPASGLPVAKTGSGLPSPTNPFVLGYGISQDIPTTVEGVPAFNPLNFQFSVTGTPLPGFATLNFLMLTEAIHDSANVEKNLNAGYFRQTFFEPIHATYTDATRGTPVFDAVMGISRGLFIRQYLDPQVLSIYTPQIPQIPDFSITAFAPEHNSFGQEGSEFKTEYKRSWRSNIVKKKSGHWTESILGASHFEQWSGTSEVKVTYRGSDTQGLPVNGQRQINVKIRGKMFNELNITNDILNTEVLDLSKCFKVKVEVPFEQDLVISSAGEAKWTVSAGYSRFPETKMEGSEKQLILTDRPGERGIFVHKEAFGILKLMDIFKLNDLLDINKAICSRMGEISNKDCKALEESINKGLKELTSTFVMPAGNVLFFNGLSTDTQGNVFSLVNYKTITGGKRF